MANFSIKADLLKVQGAFITNIKGKTATKQCLVIPIEDSGLYAGEKGIYLNLTATEMHEPKFGDTHFLKVNLDKEAYNALTEDERMAIPIIGGMRAIESKPRQVLDTRTVDIQQDEQVDDLPF